MKAPLCVPWVHPQKPCRCRTNRERGWKGRIGTAPFPFYRYQIPFFFFFFQREKERSERSIGLCPCAPEESQWVLATWFSSQGPHKGLEKASDAWQLFTEGKVLSLWTPKTPFPWRRGVWLWMNHTSGHCKLQVLKAEVREQRCTPRAEVWINSSDGITCEVVLRALSRLKTLSHCTFLQLRSNTLEVLG